MAKVFKKWSLDDKRIYAKQFSKKEIESYRKGKKNGFMQGIFASNIKRKIYSKGKITSGSKNNDFIGHTFTKNELDSLYDNIDTVVVVDKKK